MRLRITGLGCHQYFGPRETAVNLAIPGAPVAAIRKGGREYPATFARATPAGLQVGFGDSGVTADLALLVQPRYFIIQVRQVSDPAVDELLFVDIPLQESGLVNHGLAPCALALNVRTKVEGFPGDQDRLCARSFRALNFTGAQAAVMVCPRAGLRELLQTVVGAAPELPQSPLGGPWALDRPVNRGSYMFDRGVTESNVDEYIRVLRTLGIGQLNIYGRYRAYRHGDFEVNPELYPRGRASLKAVIDRLHAAGILAGFHSLSFAIAKDSRWITPAPDPRLAKDGCCTLAESISADAASIPVSESLEQVSTRPTARDDNSLILQVDRELIEFQAVARVGGWAFAGCRRGALGTVAAPHAAGAKIFRLAKVWGNFVPDGHSTLLPEIAAAAADLVNACGFDMAYFDGLDGEDRLGDPALGWHYGARFIYEFCRRLQRPLLLEMATFHHHLWVVRSRIGAWDYPTKNYRRFVDHHVAANRRGERIMLPAQLGWWPGTIDSRWAGIQGERMFPEDVEYWCGKALATDSGLALVGPDLSPDKFFAGTANQTAARIIRDYETLRLAGGLDERLRAVLAEPGAAFKMAQSPDGAQQIQRITFTKQLMATDAGQPAVCRICHPGRRQAVMLRIELLFALAPYDAPDGVTLADFSSTNEFGSATAELGFQSRLTVGRPDSGAVGNVGCYTAWRLPAAEYPVEPRMSPAAAHGMRVLPAPAPAWTRTSKQFEPPLDLCRTAPAQADNPAQSDWAALSHNRQLESGDRLGLGFWVEGDGSGAVLNVQLHSPRHIRGVADHYVVLNFTGWRYVELVESESDRIDDYGWPYSADLYGIFREPVDFKQIEGLAIWLNNIPAQGVVSVRMSPIRALPLVPVMMRRPVLRVGGARISLPLDFGTGDYLEMDESGCCKRYDARGELVEAAALVGGALFLEPGENRIELAAKTEPVGARPRLRLTVLCAGDCSHTHPPTHSHTHILRC